MPDPNQPPPQPLDYETPTNPAPRHHGLPFWLAIAIGSAFVLLLTLSILTPDGVRNLAINRRVKSAANLRSIGQCILLYSNDNSGQFPDSFQTILLNVDVTSFIFINPASNDTPATGPTTQAVANQLATPGHVSYVYLARGLTDKTVTPDTILVYEILQNPTDGANVLFGDYHVEYIDNAHITRIIARAKATTPPVTMPSP